MVENTHKECPYRDCDSSDAFAFNTGLGVGRCHSCKRSYPSAEPLKSWAREVYPPVGSDDFAVNPQPKKKGLVVNVEGDYVSTRGISPETMEFFDVKTSEDGRQFYTYPSGGVKIRNLKSKGFQAANGLKTDELFGMNLFPKGCSKMITITEGELDALSVFDMLKKGEYVNAVVSLPSATPSNKLWENVREYLDGFEKIVLSVDRDDHGDAVADKVCNMFPRKTYRVDHGELKDANDFLQGKMKREFSQSWWNAQRYTPANVFNSEKDLLSLYEDTPDQTYVETDIEGLNNKALGLMQGYFTVIKAETGIGKTEVMRLLEYGMLKRNVRIASWHLEETKVRSLLGLVSYYENDNLTRKDLIEQKQADGRVKECIRTIAKSENYYQFYMPDGTSMDDFIDEIRYLREGCGCDYIFFEPIQDVVAGVSEESKESVLADLSVRLSKLAAELNVGIVSIAHTNENGDTKYCKMIAQRAAVVVSLSRDQEAESPEERNTTTLKLEKNRPTSELGHAGRVLFDTDKFTLKEIL